MEKQGEIAYEQSRVDAAYAIADERVEFYREQLGEPTPAGDNKAASIVRQSYKTKLDRLLEVVKPSAEFLLFGRVDLGHDPDLGEEAGRTFYVGLDGLSDDGHTDPLVIAWESKMARAFREPEGYGNGRAVARRRQFTGERRELTDIIETTYVAGQPEPGSGDPLLQTLKGATIGQMQQVVATIQADQFRLMEYEPDRTLVVQGGPGTGKTIVGLHRVSVLLYRSAGELSEGDVLVVGPSPVFIRYIERVLPSLGRAAVRHAAIENVGTRGLEPQNRDEGRTREVKGGATMAQVIERYLEQRITDDLTELVVSPGTRISGSRLRSLLSGARQPQPYTVRRQELRERLRRQLGSAVSQDERQLENALNRVMPDRSERQVIDDLLTGPKLLAEAAEGLLTPEEQAALLRDKRKLADTVWTVDDIPLIDEAAFQLQGLAGVGQRYRHLVIDEAQDLSPMQLRALRRRVDATGAMTLLGDLAQATSPWATTNWEDHLASGGIEADVVEELHRSYRIPAPLLTTANQLLQVIDVDVAPCASIIEDGDEPVFAATRSLDETYATAVEFIETLLYSEAEPGQVGVIGAAHHLEQIAEELKGRNVDHEWATRSLQRPVTLVPDDQAHGLEFNHVLVVEPTELFRSHPVSGPRCLYVAMTRGRDTLSLVHSEPLPRILRQPGPVPEGGDLVGVEPSPHYSSIVPAQPPVEGWRWFVPADVGGMLEVSVASTGAAAITRVPASGGEPDVLARGTVVAGMGKLAWALLTTQGPVATLTSDSPEPAARHVLELLEAL